LEARFKRPFKGSVWDPLAQGRRENFTAAFFFLLIFPPAEPANLNCSQGCQISPYKYLPRNIEHFAIYLDLTDNLTRQVPNFDVDTKSRYSYLKTPHWYQNRRFVILLALASTLQKSFAVCEYGRIMPTV
jgi:hypothetical protein